VRTAHDGIRPGGLVKAGDTLFVLDDSDLQNTIRRLEAQIAQGKARRRSLRAQLLGSEKALTSARRSLKITKEQLSRETRLLRAGHTTAASVDQARLATNSQRERVDIAQTNTSALPGQIAQVAAEISAAEASLAQAQLDLTRTIVKAEFDAQVRTGNLEAGSLVQAGQALASLEAIDSVELAVSIPFNEVLWLAPMTSDATTTRSEWSSLLIGRQATIMRDTSGEVDKRTWTGIVTRLGPGLSERTRMFTLYVTVDKPMMASADQGTLPLLPDMFCRVNIPGRTLKDVFVLPRKALQNTNEVYIADGKETVRNLRRRTVNVALVRGEEAIVTDGLTTGEYVISTALPKAVDGMPITIRGQNERPGVAAR